MTFSVMINNAQGMKNSAKQNDIVNMIRLCTPTVLCLQETNLDPTLDKLLNVIGYVPVYNPRTQRCSGTCIFLMNTLKIISSQILSEGNMQAVVVENSNIIFHIVNIHLAHCEETAERMLY